MSTKAQRQLEIARLIAKHTVTSQPQLVELLAKAGIHATQATVSRDLDDLGAIKVRTADGETAYAIPEFEPERKAPSDHLRRVMSEWVADVNHSANLVILRTPPGCAHVVASALDRSGFPGVLGTVAGDDTLLCVATEKVGGARLARQLRELAGRGAGRMTEHAPDDITAGKTLWHGRFASGPSDELMAYTVSLPFDRRLWRDDITGSRAHVRMLAEVGLLSVAESDAVLAALETTAAEIGSARFEFLPSDEDIHTAVERRVTELAGPAGAKLHTGRSRNDQVATAFRLWTKRELRAVAGRVLELQRVLLARAEAAGDVYLPGYTHLQRAQPVLLAHHLLAHGWALSRDLDRLLATVERLDVSPLGAGALAGSSLPLDPVRSAQLLGFARTFDNSLDVTSDRDFVAEALFDLALIGIHLSRIGEEWVLWTSEEFGFARLDDAYATGSSMLPQKKNPDIAELARGKAGRVIGDLTGLLVTLKGLPLAYNRDLQEDKEPLFDAVEQVSLALAAIGGMVATATFLTDRMQAAADAGTIAATDLAEWLVARGMPFRQAHAVVGTLVRAALEPGAEPLARLVAEHPDLGPDAAALVAPGVSVRRRTTYGGAGPVPVAAQLDRFRSRVAADAARLTPQEPVRG